MCFSLTSFSQPLMGIIASSQNNAIVITCNQNLVLYSEELDNSNWQKSSLTVTPNQALDLDGNMTLDQMNASSTAHSIRSWNGGNCVDVIPGVTYTFSFDAKRGTMTDMKYSVYDNTHAANIVNSTSYYSSTSSTVQRISFNFTVPAGCLKAIVYPLRDSGVTGNCFLGRCELTNNSSCYVKTTTTIITP